MNELFKVWTLNDR